MSVAFIWTKTGLLPWLIGSSHADHDGHRCFWQFFFLSWRVIALQCCVSFWCTTWIIYVDACISSLLDLPAHRTPTPPDQVVTEHRAALPGLHSSFPPALYSHTAVCMSLILSQLLASSPSPSVLYVCVSTPEGQVFWFLKRSKCEMTGLSLWNHMHTEECPWPGRLTLLTLDILLDSHHPSCQPLPHTFTGPQLHHWEDWPHQRGAAQPRNVGVWKWTVEYCWSEHHVSSGLRLVQTARTEGQRRNELGGWGWHIYTIDTGDQAGKS